MTGQLPPLLEPALNLEQEQEQEQRRRREAQFGAAPSKRAVDRLFVCALICLFSARSAASPGRGRRHSHSALCARCRPYRRQCNTQTQTPALSSPISAGVRRDERASAR